MTPHPAVHNPDRIDPDAWGLEAETWDLGLVVESLTPRPTMPLPRVRSTVRSMMALIAALGLVFWGMNCLTRRQTFHFPRIDNESGQTLAWLSITTGSVTFKVVDVPDGKSTMASITIGGTDPDAVEGSLADGTELWGDPGILTHGAFSVQTRCVIRPGGKIDLIPSRD